MEHVQIYTQATLNTDISLYFSRYKSPAASTTTRTTYLGLSLLAQAIMPKHKPWIAG